VQLRDVEELSTEEAAEVLNMSVAALKSRLLRGRLMLREHLSKHFKRGMSYQLRKSGATALPRGVAQSKFRRVQSVEDALGGLLSLANAIPA
jgi:hypothetical protein